MSLSRSFVQRSSRVARNNASESSSLLAGSNTTSSRHVVNAARAQYRQYSSNSGSSSSSSRAKTPLAFGLVGLGGLTSWLGFSDSKDPKTTQEGMLGNHPDVDYGKVYRDVGEYSAQSLCNLCCVSVPPSTPLLIGRHRPTAQLWRPWSTAQRNGRTE